MTSLIERPHSVPHFASAYDKGRRSYGLTAAILLAWELIGIELQPTPVESLKLTLKSPQAAPYVLIALVVYFGIRTTIEWYQTDVARRRMVPSVVDITLAHFIGGSSLMLFAVQTLLRVQVANNLPAVSPPVAGVLLGVLFSIGWVSSAWLVWSRRDERGYLGMTGVLTVAALALYLLATVSAAAFTTGPMHSRWFVLGIVIGCFLVWLPIASVRWWQANMRFGIRNDAD